MKKILFTSLLVLLNYGLSMAQCAMCRATVGSNLSEGRGQIGLGINQGILFLLVMPYLTIGILFFYWYKTAQKNQMEAFKLRNRLKEILGSEYR